MFASRPTFLTLSARHSCSVLGKVTVSFVRSHCQVFGHVALENRLVPCPTLALVLGVRLVLIHRHSRYAGFNKRRTQDAEIPGRKRKQREAEEQERAGNANQETQGPQNVGEIERVFSSILGGMMLIGGLSRRSVPGLALAATGAAFLYRGATGQCKVYESLGLDTNRATMNSDRSLEPVQETTPLETST